MNRATDKSINNLTTDNAQERRHNSPHTNVLWSQLNDSQQSAVSSLSHFGYELSFIRYEANEDIVVMRQGDQVAIIDIDGSIDTHPDIIIRA